MTGLKEMCPECCALVGASRSTRPHTNLILQEKVEFSSMLGPADETYYKCRICENQWLHETGSQGMGWVK